MMTEQEIQDLLDQRFPSGRIWAVRWSNGDFDPLDQAGFEAIASGGSLGYFVDRFHRVYIEIDTANWEEENGWLAVTDTSGAFWTLRPTTDHQNKILDLVMEEVQ